VFAGGRTETVAYARPFLTPRTERVAPGHLLAVATTADVSDVVVWRWFDAVVLEAVDGIIRLWEPSLPVGRPPRRRVVGGRTRGRQRR